MSILATKARLAGLHKQLQSSWAETQSSWSDDKAREFHERYMADLTAEVEKTLVAMDGLEDLMRKVKDECE
jgi:hypothetical protein